MKERALGHHLLVELYGCPAELLNDIVKVRSILLNTADLARSTVIREAFHEFSPHGVTGILLIAESHLSIHTWPEYRYAAADLFSCRNDLPFDVIEQALARELGATTSSSRVIPRGQGTTTAPSPYQRALPAETPAPVV